MTIAFHRREKVGWSCTAVSDGFVTYDFYSGNFIGLKKETLQSSKQMRGSDDVPRCLFIFVRIHREKL